MLLYELPPSIYKLGHSGAAMYRARPFVWMVLEQQLAVLLF
eukprot:COSAG02_NODE_29480_length_568_cov_1.012793_1_plen_40_part_01